jgi:hypothetical protein
LRKRHCGASRTAWKFPPTFWIDSLDIKTENHYLRVLARATRDLYNGGITEDGMLSTMTILLDEQMRKAWNEGMRVNELDPQADMTDEWEAQLQDIINNEFNFVEQFIVDIVTAREDKTPLEPLLSRVDLWAGRYTDVVNQSILATAEPKDKYEWIYGDTEHCNTCEQLNGLVARAGEWEQAGLHPQQPPNELLTCGGWRCQCRLEPTDKRRTAGVLTRLLDIATAGGL